MQSHSRNHWPKFLAAVATAVCLTAPTLTGGLSASPEQTVVIFMSGERLSAGFAGEAQPRVELPAVVGTSGGAGPMMGMNRSVTYYGEQALERDGLKLAHAVKDSRIADRSAFEKLIRHVVSSKLGVEFEEIAIVMNESASDSADNRESTTQLFFESFGVPAFFMSPHFDSWKTMSAMAADSSFEETLITQDEYDEIGPEVIHRKSR
ncbi:MAG: hypothetical protein NXI24_21060 [bacterium]|nr:hypothetical protein [bacterium]